MRTDLITCKELVPPERFGGPKRRDAGFGEALGRCMRHAVTFVGTESFTQPLLRAAKRGD